MSFVHPINAPVAQATMDTVTIFNIMKLKTKNTTVETVPKSNKQRGKIDPPITKIHNR